MKNSPLHYRIFFLLLPLLVNFQHASFGADRPNILFVIVDDQSPFDLRVYDPKSKLETPVIDRLVAEGMVFDGAHLMGAWAGGVCKPSRHMIMSGRTLWHIPDKTTQLFNLTENPDELLIEHHDPKVTEITGAKPKPHQINLAGDPAHDTKLKEMEQLLRSEMRRYDDPYAFSDLE